MDETWKHYAKREAHISIPFRLLEVSRKGKVIDSESKSLVAMVGEEFWEWLLMNEGNVHNLGSSDSYRALQT